MPDFDKLEDEAKDKVTQDEPQLEQMGEAEAKSEEQKLKDRF